MLDLWADMAEAGIGSTDVRGLEAARAAVGYMRKRARDARR
jgi:hypothetical protein